ncbi:unnamed protein product [Paramecium sonneborni]|uniref:Uncharacterized protein n=1 Tax=Paramecium sonneborni TaxID=65129 RepID=A0A8S1RSA9_9CILI|nr:unnamed protein product [Paramecium sonneborni]
MTSKILILIIIVVAAIEQLKFQPCDTKLSILKLFPTRVEALDWDLKDAFFEACFEKEMIESKDESFCIHLSGIGLNRFILCRQGENVTTPQFNKKIASQEKVHIFHLKITIHNQFFIIDKNGYKEKIHQNENYNNYKVNTQTIVFTNKLGHEQTFFFRLTPVYATQRSGLDQSSLIKVFYIESVEHQDYKEQ